MLLSEKQLMFHAYAGAEQGGAAKEAAKEAAKTELKGDVDVDGAKLITKTKEKIKTVGADEAAQKAALDALKDADKEFKDFLDAAKKRRDLKTKVDGVDLKDGDFLHAQEILSQAKKDKAAIVGTFGDKDTALTAVDEKEVQVNISAEKTYRDMSKSLDGHFMLQRNDFWYFMQELGKMQEAKAKGLPGIKDKTTLDELNKAFEAKMKFAKGELAKGAQSVKDLTPEDKASFTRLNYTLDNMAQAEEDLAKDPDNKEHLGGAKEYREMNMVEQEARRVFWALPFDANDPSKSWRGADLNATVNWPNATGAAAKYNAAVEAFKTACDKAGTPPPKSMDAITGAKDSFKKAVDGWREIAAIAGTEANNASEKAVDDERKNYETAYTDCNKAYDVLVKRGSVFEAMVKPEHRDLATKKKTEGDLKSLDKASVTALNASVKEAKTGMEALNKYLDDVKAKYAGALSSALSVYKNGVEYDVTDGSALAKTVARWMSNEMYLGEVKDTYGLKPSMSILDNLGVFAARDTNMSKEGGDKVWYDLSVTYSGGAPAVSVYRQETKESVSFKPTPEVKPLPVAGPPAKPTDGGLIASK